MPHLVFSAAALRDLQRLQLFLAAKNPAAAKRAARSIRSHLTPLASAPDMGRPSFTVPGVRELVIPFGDAGYIARYGYMPERDEVYVLRIWHQREAGF